MEGGGGWPEKVLVSSDFNLGAELPAVAGCPGNNFITERFCWKEASKAAWVRDPDIGDIGPSGPPGIERSDML